ncbi:MAG: 30S ribosomal protein S2 [Myxococcota bacterium]
MTETTEKAPAADAATTEPESAAVTSAAPDPDPAQGTASSEAASSEAAPAETPPAETAPAPEAAPPADFEHDPYVPGDNTVSLRALVEAGVHFGHQTRRWNPKMRPYIYGARSGIHIIDLDQTVALFRRAYDFVSAAVARGGHVLFVGTKRQAQDVVVEQAQRCQMHYVTNRWLGGTLTNFRTIKQGLERLRTLERMRDEGVHAQLPKKEVVRLEKERERLEKFIGGLKGMGNLPHVMVVIDPKQESIAVAEARKLNIPVVAIVDTNCDPDLIDYIIPGNDDAIRSLSVITKRLADACLDGLSRRKVEEQPREDNRRGGGPEVEVARYRGGAAR